MKKCRSIQIMLGLAMLVASILAATACRSAGGTRPMTEASRAALADEEVRDSFMNPPVQQVDDKLIADTAGEQQTYLPDFSPELSPDYKLGAGDRLLMAYRFMTIPSNDLYQLGAGDQLRLSFPETPKYDRLINIGPDGHAVLPMIGNIDFAGKTLPQVHAMLSEHYVAHMTEPLIDIQLERSHTPTMELRESMWNTVKGQSLTMIVRPDGFIALPMLGDVQAANHTVAELQEAVKAGYAAKGINDVEVTAILEESGSSVAYVMGEVPRQGAVPLRVSMDVWRVIAQAGGFGPEADKRNVVIAKSHAVGEKRYVVNFDRWRQMSDNTQNVQIQPGDMIYVPRMTNQFAYLAGELEQPGRVVLDDETYLTVSQAVAMAGGVTSRGTQKQVLLLRPRRDQEPIILSVNLEALFQPGRSNGEFAERPWDPRVMPGDIVYAPTTFVGDLNRFAEQWFRNGIWTIIPFNASVTYSYTKGNFTGDSTN